MRDRIVRQHLRRDAVVTLKTGDTFRGVLYDADRCVIVLRNAAAVGGEGTDRAPVPVDGELLILRPDVAYLQMI